MVRIRSIAAQQGALFQSMDCSSYSRSETMEVALQDCTVVSMIVPHSSQMPQVFYDPLVVTPDTGVINWTACGFTPLTIAVDGAPVSTGVLDVEFFINYEYTFDEGSAMGMLATPPPPASSLLTSAAASLSSMTTNFFSSAAHAVGERLRDRAIKALMNATGLGRVAGAAQYALTVD